MSYYLTLRITSACDFLCKHCIYKCTKEGANICNETLDKVLSSKYKITAFSGGEPLIDMNNFERCISHLEFKNEKLTVLTNGSILWDIERLKKLKVIGDKYNLYFKLIVSNTEYHEAMRLHSLLEPVDLVRVNEIFIFQEKYGDKDDKAFVKLYQYYYDGLYIEVKNGNQDIVPLGRARANNIGVFKEACNYDIEQLDIPVEIGLNGEVVFCCNSLLSVGDLSEGLDVLYNRFMERMINCGSCNSKLIEN